MPTRAPLRQVVDSSRSCTEQNTSCEFSRLVMAAISKSGRKLGRQIFQAVDGEIDPAVGQRFFDFLGEHALGADLGEGHVEDLVASGLDDFEFDFVAARAASAEMWLACQSASCDPREPMRRRAISSLSPTARLWLLASPAD